MDKIKKQFVQFLKKIAQRINTNFSGLGLILYKRQFITNIPRLGLKSNIKCNRELYINKPESIKFILDISKTSHPLHDGFHFFNEKGMLTHIAQYLSPPIDRDITPHPLHGSRYVSALCASNIKGVIAAGIINRDKTIFYFENGRCSNLTNQWNNIFRDEGLNYKYYNIIEPHKDLQRLVKIFRKAKVGRILDLGCGAGRNLIYLTQKGFDVFGLDLAKEGIKIAQKLLNKKHLGAHLTIGNIFTKLPYKDNFFDAVIGVQVLQHGRAGQIKRAIAEIKRVLKPSGILFVTLCGRYSQGKIRYCLVKTAKKIAPYAYIPTRGDEAGLTHFIYNKNILKKHYKDFLVIDLWRDDKDYYCFLGKSKKRV